MTLRYTAGARDEGRKLYYVLRNELRLSETALKRLKAANAIRVNGEAAFTTRTLRPGDAVTCDLMLSEPAPDFPPERGPLTVLFENEGFLVANKPAGQLCHPSRARLTGTLLNLVSGYLLEREGCPNCHAVNRLDRDTSGAVLIAKNAYMMPLLTAEEARKEYIAVLFGTLPRESGVVSEPIARVEAGSMRRAVSEEGRPAVTRYEVLRVWTEAGQTLTAARFLLETGRTHQIRVHAAFLGAPVLGDRLYGTERSVSFAEERGIGRQLLHAAVLRFRDPLTGALLRVVAPSDEALFSGLT